MLRNVGLQHILNEYKSALYQDFLNWIIIPSLLSYHILKTTLIFENINCFRRCHFDRWHFLSAVSLNLKYLEDDLTGIIAHFYFSLKCSKNIQSRIILCIVEGWWWFWLIISVKQQEEKDALGNNIIIIMLLFILICFQPTIQLYKLLWFSFLLQVIA